MFPSSRFEWESLPRMYLLCCSRLSCSHKPATVFKLRFHFLERQRFSSWKLGNWDREMGSRDYKLGNLNEGSTLESFHHHLPAILHWSDLLFTLRTKKKKASAIYMLPKQQTSRVAKLRSLPNAIGQKKKKKKERNLDAIVYRAYS